MFEKFLEPILQDMNKRLALLEKENEERKKEKVVERHQRLANAKEYTHKVMKDNDERYKIAKMYEDGAYQELLAVTKSKRLQAPVDTNYDSDIPISKFMFTSEKRLRIFRKTPRIMRIMRKKFPLEKKTSLLADDQPYRSIRIIR